MVYRTRPVRVVAGFLVVVVILGGCITKTPPAEPDDWPEAKEVKVVLQPGDMIDVRYLYWSDFDQQQFVRPDGKLTLPLVGAVDVAGLTPEELTEHLNAIYADKLKDPEIVVIVRALDSQRVYVGGEVHRPGLVRMSGRITALEAIIESGGFVTLSAKVSSVVIIRHRDGKRYARSLDLRKALEKPNSEPFYLEPFDVVFVPRTAIDRVDQYVEQYLNRIIPRNVYMNFGLQRYYQTDTDDVDQRTPTQYQLTPLP